MAKKICAFSTNMYFTTSISVLWKRIENNKPKLLRSCNIMLCTLGTPIFFSWLGLHLLSLAWGMWISDFWSAMTLFMPMMDGGIDICGC